MHLEVIANVLNTAEEFFVEPEPLFGLVDWRERERSADRSGSRGGVEGGLLGLEADMGGVGGGAYQAARVIWRFEPTRRVGRSLARRSPIAGSPLIL